MARRPRKVDERAKAVMLDVRARLLGRLGLAERELDAVLDRVAVRLRERLTVADVRTADLSAIIGEELATHARDLVSRTHELTQAGVKAGVEAGHGTIRIVPGESPSGTADAAVARASEAIRRRAVVRAIPLSSRVRANVGAIGERMRTELEASIRAGESAQITAERMLDASPGRVQIPRYVRDLRDAAALARGLGDRSIIADAIEDAAGQLNRLGQRRRTGDVVRRRDGDYSIRSAGRQLAADLSRAKVEDIDRIVDRWVLDKARWQARRIARTETVEAFRAGFRESVATDPVVVGIRWELSTSHPKGDVCDVLAGQDLHGLGPGGYPKDAVPQGPHPFCSCTQSGILDEQRQERELARLEGRPEPPRPWESGTREDGDAWIRRQDERLQREILGPARLQMLRAGRAVLDSSGAPRPVWDLRGLSRPPSRSTVDVDPAALVAADRSTMVEPLPPLPGSGPSGAPPPLTPPAAPPPVVPSPPPVPAAPAPAKAAPVARPESPPPTSPVDRTAPGFVPVAPTLHEAFDRMSSTLGNVWRERFNDDRGLLPDDFASFPLSLDHQKQIRDALRVVVQTAYPELRSSDLHYAILGKSQAGGGFAAPGEGIGPLSTKLEGIAGGAWNHFGITLKRQNLEALLDLGQRNALDGATIHSDAARRGSGPKSISHETWWSWHQQPMQILMHEGIHEHSTIRILSASTGAANVIEEATTELMARRLMDRAGLSDGIGWGGYRRYIGSLIQIAEGTAGTYPPTSDFPSEPRHAEAVDRIERAAIALRVESARRATAGGPVAPGAHFSEGFATDTEEATFFLRALGVPDDKIRAALVFLEEQAIAFQAQGS